MWPARILGPSYCHTSRRKDHMGAYQVAAMDGLGGGKKGPCAASGVDRLLTCSKP